MADLARCALHPYDCSVDKHDEAELTEAIRQSDEIAADNDRLRVRLAEVEARLAAVLALCDDTPSSDLRHLRARVRAAARGDAQDRATGHTESHLIQFTDNGWTIAHPLQERIDLDSLFDCALRWDDDDPGVRGRFVLNDDGTLGPELAQRPGPEDRPADVDAPDWTI